MNRFLRCALVLPALFATTAMNYAGKAPPPGVLDHEDDLHWVMYHDAKITVDEEKGEYRATFSPQLARMDGATVRISGYMLPIEANRQSAHFVLTRRSTGCMFCPPNEPTEAIEIFASRPVPYRATPVTAEGRLHLVARSEEGLFYRLDQAKIS